MSFDKIFDLTAGVYFNFIIYIYGVANIMNVWPLPSTRLRK